MLSRKEKWTTKIEHLVRNGQPHICSYFSLGALNQCVLYVLKLALIMAFHRKYVVSEPNMGLPGPHELVHCCSGVFPKKLLGFWVNNRSDLLIEGLSKNA